MTHTPLILLLPTIIEFVQIRQTRHRSADSVLRFWTLLDSSQTSPTWETHIKPSSLRGSRLPICQKRSCKHERAASAMHRAWRWSPSTPNSLCVNRKHETCSLSGKTGFRADCCRESVESSTALWCVVTVTPFKRPRFPPFFVVGQHSRPMT